MKRFRDHGEAIRWSFVFFTRWWMKLLPIGLVGLLIQYAVVFLLDGTPPDITLFAIPLVLVPLALWFVIAPFVYLCVVLAGGVMSREERERREREGTSLPC